MLRFVGLAVFTILTLIDGVSAVSCWSGYSYYYCSMGQSCGNYYGDCRGLPTYAIISIVSGCILLLSICIRCCAYAASGNGQGVRRVPIVRRHGRAVRPAANAYQGNASTVVPIHSIQEDAPPPYTVATSAENPKY